MSTIDEPIQFARPYFGPEEAEAAAAVVRSGWVVGGTEQQELERLFAEHCQVNAAVACSSWTAGAFLVLHAWGIKPGDEIIVPSLTFIASVNVIVHAGAIPVFADIDPQTWNVSPDDVARRITPRTKAIMPIDQIGLPCDIDSINSIADAHGLRVLDDAACGIGSRFGDRPVGSAGDVSIFSLHARKVVTTGEGGMIVTNDEPFAERLRRLRHQGMSLSDFARKNASPTAFETYDEIGYNSRMTDIQAAIGVVQMNKLPEILEKRAAIAMRYTQHLSNHPLIAPPHVPPGVTPNWQTYQVIVRDEVQVSRNRLMEMLFDLGIPTKRGVMASHLEQPYKSMMADLPITEYVAERTFQLPMHPALSLSQQQRVLDVIDDIAAEVC